MPCSRMDLGDGKYAIICGPKRKQKPCSFCQKNGGSGKVTKLCDFQVGNQKTCDVGMCDRHATTKGQEDYCPIHKDQTPKEG